MARTLATASGRVFPTEFPKNSATTNRRWARRTKSRRPTRRSPTRGSASTRDASPVTSTASRPGTIGTSTTKRTTTTTTLRQRSSRDTNSTFSIPSSSIPPRRRSTSSKRPIPTSSASSDSTEARRTKTSRSRSSIRNGIDLASEASSAASSEAFCPSASTSRAIGTVVRTILLGKRHGASAYIRQSRPGNTDPAAAATGIATAIATAFVAITRVILLSISLQLVGHA
mmetsp:Transcript_7194/g.19495  ORF Transcript_7194/g.19495 Transcript_7194/m.19495 type:complete len:228 (-) Transcript_7194:84-767(-)